MLGANARSTLLSVLLSVSLHVGRVIPSSNTECSSVMTMFEEQLSSKGHPSALIEQAAPRAVSSNDVD